jgi:hypothetical protein
MPTQASTSKLTFTRCSKWSTKSCPNLRNLKMEQWFQFDDQTVKDMNRLYILGCRCLIIWLAGRTSFMAELCQPFLTKSWAGLRLISLQYNNTFMENRCV